MVGEILAITQHSCCHAAAHNNLCEAFEQPLVRILRERHQECQFACLGSLLLRNYIQHRVNLSVWRHTVRPKPSKLDFTSLLDYTLYIGDRISEVVQLQTTT